MNWRLSSLDPFALVSNSDAHSPAKLGREANIFDTDLSYDGILSALRERGDKGLLGTVEFFPEEGKYHYDGHRKCETRLHPRETIGNKGLCPVCGKPVTVGVMARVEELADRPDGEKGARWRPYRSMIPLVEILGDCLGTSAASKKAETLYRRLAETVGNEFAVLLDAPLDRIEKEAGSLVSEGIRRVRSGEISVQAGYDGEYGIIKIFSDKERSGKKWQLSLFHDDASASNSSPKDAASQPDKPDTTAPHKKKVSSASAQKPHGEIARGENASTHALNSAQLSAVNHRGSHLLIIAGPGTGKTHTLVRRIAILSRENGAHEKSLAITFTNKAAEEMRERLSQLLEPSLLARVTAGTFHHFCLSILREHGRKAGLVSNFGIASDDDRRTAATRAWPGASVSQRNKKLEEVSRAKTLVAECEKPELEMYDKELRAAGLLDFDDLLLFAVRLLSSHPTIRTSLQQRYRCVFVDEYQDINEVQHELLMSLVGNGNTITAIGDPNQAIYGFRGSDVSFFGRFSESFPGATTMFLSENYRTAAHLLKASAYLITAPKSFNVPALTAKFLLEGRLVIHEAATEKSEAEFVVHRIERLLGGTSMFSHDSSRVDADDNVSRTFGDCAVLYRTNAQSAPLVEAFERSGIPFQVAGEKPLAEYPIVKDVVAVLSQAARQDQKAKAPHSLHIVNLSEKAIQQLSSRVAELLTKPAPAEAISFIVDNPAFKAVADVDNISSAALDRLGGIARQSPGLLQFLDSVLLQQSEDGGSIRSEKVSLLTLHSSKGLEFQVVFIVGCEKGLLPLEREGKEFDSAEERRLLYVGMTRAKERLYLTRAKRRTMFGRSIEAKPSPFLSDINEELKIYELAAPMKAKKVAESEQTDLFGELFSALL